MPTVWPAWLILHIRQDNPPPGRGRFCREAKWVITDNWSSTIQYKFDIESLNFQSAGQAAGKVKQILRGIGYEPQITRRAAIITYELEMNLVIHGGGGTLEVELSPEVIKIVTKDQGPGIPDVGLAMQEGYSTAPLQVREMGFGAGMGLPNIRRWADKLTIETKVNQGTKLWAFIYCNKQK